MSIKSKINLSFLALGVLAALAVSAFNYVEIKKSVISNAFKKAELINSFAMASRTYTVNTMRPLAIKAMGPEQFHPEIMGGFFVARAIAETFSKDQPGYSFKQATINPVNSKNKADANETQIIKKMAAINGVGNMQGIIEKDQQRYFYIAKPVIAKQGCLKCHGDPANAPKGRKTLYPGPGGYHYKADDVVAAFVTYVPVEKALSEVNRATAKIAAAGIGFIVIIFFVIWFMIDRIVTRPLVVLTGLTDDVSRGKSLEKDLTYRSKDEIGELYQAFDRMRKSVVKLIRMVQKAK